MSADTEPTIAELRQLYRETTMDLLEPAVWERFLQTVAYNYARDFDDQVLIYAQKPNAIAVLTEKAWNTKFHRNVQSKQSGIHLFSPIEEDAEIYTVFDITDTQADETSLDVPVFDLDTDKSGYSSVLKALNKQFATSDSTLFDAILSAATIAVENTTDSELTELLHNAEAKGLRRQHSIREKIVRLISSSAAYICAIRCHIQDVPTADFRHLELLNPYVLCTVGRAISRISASILKIIIKNSPAKSRKAYLSPNRTFDEPNSSLYNRDTNKTLNTERQADNDDTEFLRTKKDGISARAQIHGLHRDESEQPTSGASANHTAAGERNVGSPDRAESSVIRADGGTQAAQSDAVDRSDDQSARDDAGASASGSDLRVKKNQPRKATGLKNTLPLFLSQEQVDTLLQDWAVYANGKYRIFEQFQKKETPKENANFLKELYSGSGRGAPDGLSILCNNKGLEITSIDGQSN